MRTEPALALLLAAAACGSSRGTGTASSTYSPPRGAAVSGGLNAGVTAGLGVVAAGINRAITGECMAACRPGTRCDHASGGCVALPCNNDCPADSHCAMIEGKETCVRSDRDVAQGSEISPLEEAPPRSAPAPQGAEDPCKGLCFKGEQCVSKGGVADCVPRKATPPRSPQD